MGTIFRLDTKQPPCNNCLVRPIGHRILIEPSPAKEVSAGGIVTPEQYRQRNVTWDGTVRELGTPPVTRKGIIVPWEFSIGQRVLVNRYSVRIVEGDKEMWLSKPEDIVAVIE